jgi:hypothetical protein
VGFDAIALPRKAFACDDSRRISEGTAEARAPCSSPPQCNRLRRSPTGSKFTPISPRVPASTARIGDRLGMGEQQFRRMGRAQRSPSNPQRHGATPCHRAPDGSAPALVGCATTTVALSINGVPTSDSVAPVALTPCDGARCVPCHFVEVPRGPIPSAALTTS